MSYIRMSSRMKGNVPSNVSKQLLYFYLFKKNTFTLLVCITMLSIYRGRGSIEPGQKLMIMRRFLAAGMRFMSLQYAFRVAQNAISLFVPEVFHAIYE